MDTEENRFAHLLQPIRDLTKNWEIDVASELNDYLEELDQMCITIDDGKIKLNFAEAALLIQGSACIYSKKVEMLYNLVFQTLEIMKSKSKRPHDQGENAEEEGGHKVLNKRHRSNDDEFSSYDDSLSGKTLPYTDSISPVDVARLPPESLILPETSEKQKLPFISIKGEVLCSCKDFRMNTFIAGDGCLIRLIASRGAEDDSTGARIFLNQEQGGGLQAAMDAEVGASEDIPAGGGDEGVGFFPLEEDVMEMDHGAEEHIDRHQATSDSRVLRARDVVQPSEEDLKKQREEEEKEKERAQAANIWRLHDSTATMGKDNPMKIGKFYKVPDGLDDGGKRKRKNPAALADFCSWFSDTYAHPERRLKSGPRFIDLNYVYLSKMKEKLKTRKRILRKKGVTVSDEELRKTFLEPEGEVEEERPEGLGLPNLQGADDDLDDDQGPLLDDIPVEFGGGPDMISPEVVCDPTAYESHVKEAVDQFLLSSQQYRQETALSLRIQSWEEMIRPRLEITEASANFDIHDYEDKVVAALNEVGNRRSFASIVQGIESYEACKYMLASLQLANDYTVEIDSVEGLEESINTFGLTLLTTHRSTERFQTLQATERTANAS